MATRFLIFSALTLFVAEDGLASTSVPLTPPKYLFTRIIDAFTLKLVWQVQTDAPASSIHYRIGLRRGSLEAPETYTRVRGDQGHFVFGNLKPYTYYYFRVQKGDNSGNYGRFSRSIWEETPETEPSAPPTNVTAYNTSSMGIMVFWDQVPAKQRNGHILGYKLCYRKRSDPPITDLCLSLYPLSMHLGGLEPYTEYVITVKAYTNIGDGPPCDPIYVWTDEFVPSRAPVIKSLTSTTTTITVSWSHIPQQFVHGILRGYYIVQYEWHTGKKTIKRVNATTTTITIKDRKMNATYGIKMAGLTRVRGYIRSGQGGPIQNITTKLGCGPPKNVRTSSDCPRCMKVEWAAAELGDPSRAIIDYIVTLASETQAAITKHVGGGQLRVSISDLTPYTRYTITIAARTSDGMGAQSQPVVQETDQDVPGIAPEKVTVKSTGPNSLLVKWSPVPADEVNGELKGYHVYYSSVKSRVRRNSRHGLTQRNKHLIKRSIDSHKRSRHRASFRNIRKRSISHAGVMHALAVNASSRGVEISGLEPNSAYSVEVAAFTIKGSGPKSAPVTVRTEEDVPRKAPTALRVESVTATTITVTWQPLSPLFTNGKLQGYHVIYKKKTADQAVIENMVSVNATILRMTLHGLEPLTTYKIWVAGFTSKGKGPGSKHTEATTLKIVPGKPMQVYVDVTSPTSVQVTWKNPAWGLGIVKSYMVRWVLRGQRSSSPEGESQKIVKVTDSYHRETIIGGLQPYSMYTFTVREESTESGWGPFSDAVDQMMPEDAPSEPLEVSVLKKDGPRLVIQWKRPKSPNGVIRKYIVYYINDEGDVLWDKTVNSELSGDTIQHEHTLPDKTAEYKIRVQAFNSVPGKMSDDLTVQHLSDDSLGYARNSNKYLDHLPWLLVGLGAVVVLLAATFVFVMIRRSRKRAAKNKSTQEITTVPKTFGAHRPVPVPDLKAHCVRFHGYDDSLFIEEYRSLSHLGPRATFEAAQTPYNKTKNRYPNILPYDHSRVVLRARKDSQGSDYINANFVDGYGCPQKYIAAQGPLTETIKDFWRLIWEKGCTTIVMLGDTEHKVKLRSDCERYWPEDGHQEYGDVAVSVVDVTHMTDWTVRTFLVWSTDPECMDKREVTQFQFTAWPDQGVPENTAPLIIFHHKYRYHLSSEETGPILVHCGAGVGRTGTFIAIDSLMDQMVMEGVVDVYGFVAQMRTQRNFMVQTHEQYAFIYDVLRDASLCGITEIPSQEIASSLLVLRDNDPDIIRQRQDEFENLQVCKDEEFERSVAYIRENIVKNRCPDVVPFDTNRIRLSITNDIPCSEYINASYIDSYNEAHEYIATQAPMENTINEFWQMVWEQKCTAIVMLTELQDRGQIESELYWPRDGCVHYGKYIVTKIDEEELDDHTQRVFKLRCHGSMDSLLVYHFQYHNWSAHGMPPRMNGLVFLHEQVQKIQSTEDHGPTVVHCSDGAGRTGVFLALAISIERLEAEDTVDIFQTVRWLRSQRPAFVGSIEQYSCCYQAVKSYLSWRTRATNDYCTA